MGKIKVLHFELDENYGGIETFLLNLYSGIDKNKYQFDFISRSSNPAKKDDFLALSPNSRIYKVSNIKYIVRYIRDIKKILTGNRYDIVHIHKNSCTNILPFILAKKYSSAKIICHSHNTRSSVDKYPNFIHYLNRTICYKLADIHLACSDVAGKWMYGNKQYHIIINGINVDQYLFNLQVREKYRDILKIDKNADVFINIGRFTHQKNHDRLIEIFIEYLKIKKNSFLILVGEGTLKDEIIGKVQKYNITNNVIFLSNRNDVNNLLMTSDFFVMPSFYEGLPFVSIEAQASGLNLFLSDTISNEVKVTDCVYWFSLKESNRNIVNQILKINKNSKRANANKCVLNSKYNLSNTVKQITNIYQTLLSERDGIE